MCICTANHGIHAYVPVEMFEVYQLVNHGKKCFSMDIFLLTKYKEYTENVHFNIDLIIIIACFLITIQSINVDFPAKTQLIWFPWMPLILFVFFFLFCSCWFQESHCPPLWLDRRQCDNNYQDYLSIYNYVATTGNNDQFTFL